MCKAQEVKCGRKGCSGLFGRGLVSGVGWLAGVQPRPGESVAEAVADLRREIAAADAVLFRTPEYAGSLWASASRACRLGFWRGTATVITSIAAVDLLGPGAHPLTQALTRWSGASDSAGY